MSKDQEILSGVERAKKALALGELATARPWSYRSRRLRWSTLREVRADSIPAADGNGGILVAEGMTNKDGEFIAFACSNIESFARVILDLHALAHAERGDNERLAKAEQERDELRESRVRWQQHCADAANKYADERDAALRDVERMSEEVKHWKEQADINARIARDRSREAQEIAGANEQLRKDLHSALNLAETYKAERDTARRNLAGEAAVHRVVTEMQIRVSRCSSVIAKVREIQAARQRGEADAVASLQEDLEIMALPPESEDNEPGPANDQPSPVEFRDGLPSEYLRRACRFWDDPGSGSDWGIEFSENGGAVYRVNGGAWVVTADVPWETMQLRPHRRAWADVETEATVLLGRHDAEVGNRRRSYNAICRAILGKPETGRSDLETAYGDSYRAAYKPERNTDGMCHAGRDGDCDWTECPQLADEEPERSGRSCPLRDPMVENES